MNIREIKPEFASNLIGEYNQQKHIEMLEKILISNFSNLKISPFRIFIPSNNHRASLKKALHQVDQAQLSFDLGLKIFKDTLLTKVLKLTLMLKRKSGTV